MGFNELTKGLTILKSIDILKKSNSNTRKKKIIVEVQAEYQRDKDYTFNISLLSHPEAFS